MSSSTSTKANTAGASGPSGGRAHGARAGVLGLLLAALVFFPARHAEAACKLTTTIGSGNEEGFGSLVQPDGSIVVVGYSHNGTDNDFAVVRYLANCTLDTSFGGGDGKVTTDLGGDDQAQDVDLDSLGRIVVAGFSRDGASQERVAVARYDSSGNLDTTNFNSPTGYVKTSVGGVDDQGRDVVVDGSDRIVVAGWSEGAGADKDTLVMRYNVNGSLDTAGFNSPLGYTITQVDTNQHDFGHAVTIQPSDGKIVVCGDRETPFDITVLRYQTNGLLDTGGFNAPTGYRVTDVAGGNDTCRDVEVQSTGEIVVAGHANAGGNDQFALVRYTSTGGLDGSLGGTGKVTTDIAGGSPDYAQGVAIQSDGDIVTTGWTWNGSNWDIAVTRHLSDGNPDTSWDTDGKVVSTFSASSHEYPFPVKLQADGVVVVAGASDTGGTWDFALIRYFDSGAEDLATAVELSSFLAQGLNQAVELTWETASELDNLGFHVHRSSSEDGPYERLTASVIPGLGSSPVGASYRYQDLGLTNGVSYYYRLEDVGTDGKTSFHGPVSAIPGTRTAVESGSGSAVGENPPGEEDAASTSVRIAYGDPESNALRVVRHGRGPAELELLTGGFYAYPQGDGTVRLEVPGFERLSDAGAPELPVRRSWLDAIAGRGVALGGVVAHEVEGFSGLRPVNAAAGELVELADGTIQVARRRARQAYRTSDALYPESAARLLEVGFQGELKKALVELVPLRWDEASGRLLLARRLTVRVTFQGRVPGELSLGGSRGRRPRAKTSGERAVVARLAVREPGLYRARFEELFPAERRGVRLSELRLSRQGEPVAYRVEPEGDRFRPGSRLYFWSAGAALSPWGPEAVYELERGAAGVPMEVVAAAPSGVTRPYGWRRLELEQNRLYQPGLLEAEDLWLWDLVVSGRRRSYPFQTSDLVASGEPGRLQVRLEGASDFVASPDHHVRVLVNGAVAAERSWDGKRPLTLDAELWPGVLAAGENVLELENVGDTAAAYSLVALDRISVEYPAALAAEAGEYQASFRHGGAVELNGLGTSAALLDLTGDQPQWLTGAEPTPGGVRFRVEGGHRYLAVSPESVRVPELRPATAGGLRATSNQADYVLLAPRAYLDAAQPLLERRRSQGLAAMGVAVEELFDEFGYGEPTPGAIRDFLGYAYHEWRAPSPRYVLLLGDATFDPKDYLGSGTANDVPALAVKTRFLWTASDPAYGAVNGDDLLPDLAVGRLPASSADEAGALVEKLLAWEDGGWDPAGGPFVLVADDPDLAGDFEADAERVAETLLAGRELEKIYLSQQGRGARVSIRAAFDRGAGVISYLGHGGMVIWASENVLNFGDVATLAPQPQQPLLLTMNCLNGYFHSPGLDSLSELLVLAEARGAIAAFSPSGMSIHSAAILYHEALLAELLSRDHARLGDAVLAAQVRYADSGALPELLSIYHLFGDPGLTLR